jgi:hypothetical protein
MRWSNITAGEIIEALSKAPRDYKVLNVVTGVVLDVNTDSIIFVNNYTINEYLGEPERYKILGHGEEEK